MSSIRMTLAGVSSIAGVKSNDTLSSWLKRTTRALGLPLLGILVFLFITNTRNLRMVMIVASFIKGGKVVT